MKIMRNKIYITYNINQCPSKNVKGAGFQQRAGHFLMIKRALRELDQYHHSHLKSKL
jgi:hypothetical protein